MADEDADETEDIFDDDMGDDVTEEADSVIVETAASAPPPLLGGECSADEGCDEDGMVAAMITIKRTF